MTVAEFKLAAGLAPDGWVAERTRDGLRQMCAPGENRGEPGWWWCLAAPDDHVLAVGWAAVDVLNRNAGIAHAMVRFDARQAA